MYMEIQDNNNYETQDNVQKPSSWRFRGDEKLQKYRKYLPSSKMTRVIGVLLIIILGYIIIPRIPVWFDIIKTSISKKTPQLPTPKNPISNTSSTETDTDKDGIPDWQEALFSLDPNDADSDNDGVNDTVSTDLEKLAENPNIVTQSDKLILTILAELQKDGGIDNLTTSEITEKIQTEILKMAESIESGFTQYTEKDIILTDNSQSSITTYKSTTSPIVKRVKPTNEITRKIYSVVSPNDTKQYPVVYINTLKSSIEQLLKIPVPRTISNDHLRLVNALSLLHDFTNSMHNDKVMYENTDNYIKVLIVQKNINAIFKTTGNMEVFFSLN